MYTTLISVEQLANFAKSSVQPLMIFDCTFDLMKPELGQQQFDEAHIPGAVYVNLDKHLSSKNDLAAASGGRHPLPSRETFAAWLSSIGFTNAHQAVVYDRNGVNYCGRLWWMLKWAGHEAVAVLDGGLQAWQAAGNPVDASKTASKLNITPSNYTLASELVALAAINTVANNLSKPSQTILDARGAPRFRGEVEPLDPAAGRRQRPEHRRSPLRQRRECRAQCAGDGAGRIGPPSALCRQLERVVQRHRTTRGARLG
jgi:thiosulfate/3-mercaptopyruvate sulfurtransferase